MPDKISPAEQQARNELANAKAHGSGEAEKAARKRLAALGVTVEEAAKSRRAAAEPPAAEEADEGEKKSRRTPPQGRATPAKAQTRA